MNEPRKGRPSTVPTTFTRPRVHRLTHLHVLDLVVDDGEPAALEIGQAFPHGLQLLG
jgi:hypothetical protein